MHQPTEVFKRNLKEKYPEFELSEKIQQANPRSHTLLCTDPASARAIENWLKTLNIHCKPAFRGPWITVKPPWNFFDNLFEEEVSGNPTPSFNPI